MHSPCNMCNIPIYFCNISIYFCNNDTKHLQHASETPETLKTYSCNIRFLAQNISLQLRRMEAHRHVEVTGVLAGDAELGSGI
jgi:tRNA(Arg) A34 adenosine deaminase TadA